MADIDNAAEEESNPRPGASSRCMSFMKRHVFPITNLTSIALGLALGFVLKFSGNVTEDHKLYIDFPGELLMQMLQSMAIPLIVTSVVIGTSDLSIDICKKNLLFSGAFFVLTSCVAVVLGLILVLVIGPGVSDVVNDGAQLEETSSSILASLYDLALNLLPANVARSGFQQYKTEWVHAQNEQKVSASLGTNMTELQMVGVYVEGTNILALITISLYVGMTLSKHGKSRGVFGEGLVGLCEATKGVFKQIMYYLPVGVTFMIMGHVIEVHDWEATFKLLKFVAVVILGLAIHAGALLPLMFFVCTRRNPFTVLYGVSPALLTALLISSSSATLPHSFQCLEDRVKVDKRIMRLMMPIGTTANMNGTALYEVVACIFIAQLNNIHLSISQLLTLSVTSVVSTMGAAGIPATGAVTTILVLASVGIPAKEAAILVVVEWLLDRCCTVINVFGNCIGVALVDQISKEELKKMDSEAHREEMPCEAQGDDLGKIQLDVMEGSHQTDNEENN